MLDCGRPYALCRPGLKALNLCMVSQHQMHADKAGGLQEEDVRGFWEECGEVAEVDLMRFPDTGRFKGIAFITFGTVRALVLCAHAEMLLDEMR